MGWVDSPILLAFEYFSGVMATCYNWAVKYAALFGTVGLVWIAIKLILHREQVKNALWDMFFKWLGFTLVMTFYPMLCYGMSSMGHDIGLNAGAGRTVVVTELKKLRNICVQDLQKQKKWAEDMVDELKTVSSSFQPSAKFENTYNYQDFLESLEDDIKHYNWGFSEVGKLAKNYEKLEQLQEQSKDFRAYSASTLALLDKVLIERNLDGTIGNDLTSDYVDLDIFIKDANGDETDYISAAALLRIVALTGTIMRERLNVSFNNESESIQQSDINFVEKGVATVGSYLKRVPALIECMFCVLVLFFSTVFCAIQYQMTIIEYIIVTGLFAVFMPLMLFDGTKDIPKKFVPVLTSFLMKIIVMTLCLMFVFYIMVMQCVNEINYDGGMNPTKVLEILLFGVLCFILTQNAPKIAQTIMTGQPQLSMGEAAQAAGSMAGGAVGGAKLATKTAKTGAKVAGGVTKGAANFVGSAGTKVGQVLNARKQAKQGVQDVIRGSGQTFSKEEAKKLEKRAVRKATVDELVNQPLNNMKNGIAGGINGFLHNKPQGGAGAGGGAGNPNPNPYANPNRTFANSRTADGKNEKFMDFANRRVSESGAKAREMAMNMANDEAFKKLEAAEKSDISGDSALGKERTIDTNGGDLV